MKKLIDVIVFLCIFGICYCLVLDEEKTNKVKRSARGRQRGSANFGNIDVRHLPIGLQRGLQNNNELNPEDFTALTPAPLRPDEVQCQVPVKETRFYDGRCIILGGSSERSACQSGTRLDINSNECKRRSQAHGGGRGRGGRGRGGSNRRRGRQ